VKRHVLHVELTKQLRREVQPGRRRGRRPRLLRVDRLVSLGIVEPRPYVRGKRGLAGRVTSQPDEPAAAAERFQQLDIAAGAVGPLAFRRGEPHPGPQAAAGTGERLPDDAVAPLDEQDLGLSPTRAEQVQPGRHDAGVVDDEEGSIG
jgi:hypothetical protein